MIHLSPLTLTLALTLTLTLIGDADIPKATVDAMRQFYAASSAFPYILRFSATTSALGDTSFLWMREFYLELCHRVQVA